MEKKFSTSADFEKLKRLGRGSYGEVFKVRRKQDGKVYVLKIIDMAQMSKEEMRAAVFEVKLLAKVHSEFVCKYFDSF